MQPIDFAVDLETMGRVPGAPVPAIALVSFDRETQEVGVHQFYAVIEMGDAFRWGDKPDGETVAWWLRQSEKARASLTDVVVTNTQTALATLLSSLADPNAEDGHEFDHIRLWGNGASFDLGILGGLFDRMGLIRPWQFCNERDMRTMVDLYPEARDVPRSSASVAHNALDDATHQATVLAEAFRLHGRRTTLRVVDTSEA